MRLPRIVLLRATHNNMVGFVREIYVSIVYYGCTQIVSFGSSKSRGTRKSAAMLALGTTTITAPDTLRECLAPSSI